MPTVSDSRMRMPKGSSGDSARSRQPLVEPEERDQGGDRQGEAGADDPIAQLSNVLEDGHLGLGVVPKPGPAPAPQDGCAHSWKRGPGGLRRRTTLLRAAGGLAGLRLVLVVV